MRSCNSIFDPVVGILSRGFHRGTLAHVGEFLKKAIHVVFAGKLANPVSGNGFHPAGHSGQTAGDTTRGVGVPAEINGFEHAFLETFRR